MHLNIFGDAKNTILPIYIFSSFLMFKGKRLVPRGRAQIGVRWRVLIQHGHARIVWRHLLFGNLIFENF